MATAEKTREQQKQFQVPDDILSDEDYDSAEDVYSDEEQDEEAPPNQKQQLQRRRQQQRPQQPDDVDEYSDEDDYYSDEYDDDYSDDDEAAQGQAMQPYQDRTSDMNPSGGMNMVNQEKKSLDDEEGMKLKLELNLEIEVELKARIHGDLTLALM